MEKYSDLNNLYEAYMQSKKSSSWKPQVQMYEMVDQGRMPLIDVQNSFKSWLGTYDKLLSYRTKSSMKALYTDLFER